MDNQTPQLITAGQFNTQVRGWSVSIRNKITRNAPVSKGKLRNSIENFVDEKNGISTKIRYNFERHGVFIHYGVGRGYIRVNGEVIRGRGLNKNEKFQYWKRGERKKDIAKLRVIYDENGIKRVPYDWFDIEIRRGLVELADIVQEYKGDMVMRKVLEQIDKATIQKKI